MDSSLTYVYCLVSAARRPSVTGAPRGLPGTGKVRAIPVAAGRYLIAADAPSARYDAEAIDRGLRDLPWVSRCALAHEAVVEHFLGARAVVPVKLFTLYRGDERAVAEVRKLGRPLERAIRDVAGCREWSVRLLLRAEDEQDARPTAPAPRTGLAFLTAKKAAVDERRQRLERARADAAQAFRELAEPAARALRRPPPVNGGGALLLDGVFLVRFRDTVRWRTCARRLADRLVAAGAALEVSGPWPPYHFVTGLA